MNIENQLAGIPLFGGLPVAQLNALAGICRLCTYRKGQLIFAEGDEGVGFYIVQSGRVRIFKLFQVFIDVFHLTERNYTR